MSESPQFVRSIISDKGSYVINGNASNDVTTQIEYKEVKSPAFERLNLWSKGKVQIPRWLVKKIRNIF
jgi:hypothetical protein